MLSVAWRYLPYDRYAEALNGELDFALDAYFECEVELSPVKLLMNTRLDFIYYVD